MSSPLSTYDVLYKGMSEEDRARLQTDICGILKKCAEEADAVFTASIQKAVTRMYDHRYSNPWYALLEENADAGGFIEALSDNIWEVMLKSSPRKMLAGRSWGLKELIDAWRKNFPGEWEELCRDEIHKDW